MRIKTTYLAAFQIILTLMVAAVYLSEPFKNFLQKDVYNFLSEHKDLIIGVYYVYLGYEIYAKYFQRIDFVTSPISDVF